MRCAGTMPGRSTASFESTSNEPIPGEGLVSGGLDESAIVVLRSARIPGIQSIFGSNTAAWIGMESAATPIHNQHARRYYWMQAGDRHHVSFRLQQ